MDTSNESPGRTSRTLLGWLFEGASTRHIEGPGPKGPELERHPWYQVIVPDRGGLLLHPRVSAGGRRPGGRGLVPGRDPPAGPADAAGSSFQKGGNHGEAAEHIRYSAPRSE